MDTPDPTWRPRLSANGSALVSVDDERAARASVLVLQELGLTVDLVADLESALDWLEAARYEYVLASGRADEETLSFALRARYLSRETRVILLAEPGFPADGLNELDIEVLAPPIDVNRLMGALRPLT